MGYTRVREPLAIAEIGEEQSRGGGSPILQEAKRMKDGETT